MSTSDYLKIMQKAYREASGGQNGSVANFLGGHATFMDLTGFIPPTNGIAAPDTPRLSSTTDPSGSYA
jgi:hypothetical protein